MGQANFSLLYSYAVDPNGAGFKKDELVRLLRSAKSVEGHESKVLDLNKSPKGLEHKVAILREFTQGMTDENVPYEQGNILVGYFKGKGLHYTNGFLSNYAELIQQNNEDCSLAFTKRLIEEGVHPESAAYFCALEARRQLREDRKKDKLKNRK